MKTLFKALKATSQVVATQVPPAAWPWLAAQLSEHAQGPLLVVAPEAAQAPALHAAVQALLPKTPVHLYPAWDVMPYDRLGPNAAVVAARQAIIQELVLALSAKHFNGVIITSLPALLVRCHPAQQMPLTMRTGDTLPPTQLVKQLVAMGYQRTEVVQLPGTFAVRGGLIDVWPPSTEEPLRLDFFGDELEQIRTFEASSQQSLGKQTTATVPAAGETLTPARIETFRQRYRELFGAVGEIYTEVSEGMWPTDAGQLAPLLSADPWPNLLQALPSPTTMLVPTEIEAHAQGWYEAVEDARQARIQATGAAAQNQSDSTRILHALPPELLLVAPEEWAATLPRYEAVYASPFGAAEGVGLPLLAMLQATSGNRHTALQQAVQRLQGRLMQGWSVVITAPHPEGLQHFLRALEGAGLASPRILESFSFKPGLQACVAPLLGGFEDTEAQLSVLSEADVFGARKGTTSKHRPRSAEEILATLSTLKVGDYVVHEAHGVGQYQGLVTLDVGAQGAKQNQDFIKLIYADDDRLFVPVEQLGLVSRYKGAESGTVQLDKLGTGGWETRKNKVKADLLEMADELLKTAAARALAERPPFAAAGALYDEFCAGFPYELTADQARVVAEVEADLTGGVPMDRLVVGDVGFGKTEVALRAAFLAAQSGEGRGRQVAIVCPTTLLARQHAQVFAERFEAVGMAVGHLSRLVGTKQTAATKAALANGSLKVVVGTHALLAASTKFANLGLVIIDEEQRFGVAHKEKLKSLKADIDVLTLSATPIPRTLQLAVGGVRQLSLIATPPIDRHAVHTHVLPWDTPTLHGALSRELARGGQVYVVAPYVEDLPKLAETIRGMLPHARCLVAHGQLPESELENTMLAFYQREADVLIATTIIESGLDVPNANTLIVTRADRFGLAQLYQLRGRVGRSTQQAFAYFILPEGGFGAQGHAATRLSLLQQLQGLGAGLTIANYDMDLRGFGNVLGKEQSGNIRDIGFELYSKLLREAVTTRTRQLAAQSAAQNKTQQPQITAALNPENVTLKLGASYLIPAAYVPDEALRLQLYRQLAASQTSEAIEAFGAELRDRFGAHPTEVAALLQVVGLRNRAAALNISKIEVGEKATSVAFHKGRFANPEGLIKLLQRLAGVVQVRPDSSLLWFRQLASNPTGGVGVLLSELESVL